MSAPNKNKTNRIISVRFFISWFATGLVTMQCIVCTLCVLLHAVQLTQRFASKLARLCYYARFAHYKSCCPHQKRQSERVVFFHATADLKQNYVLSANGTAFACPCTLCSWRNALQVNLLAYAITLASLTTSPVVRTKKRQSERVVFFHAVSALYPLPEEQPPNAENKFSGSRP